jgi:hypothetical protein
MGCQLCSGDILHHENGNETLTHMFNKIKKWENFHWTGKFLLYTQFIR